MLIDKLKAYCPGALPMHMPGHKRNVLLAPYLSALGADADITEIDGFDDLHAPTGILRDAMRRASRLWGSEESFFLVNGSTAGILSAIYALSGNGGEAIVARSCHKSVYHALEITGLKPHFLLPETGDIPGACGAISPESVKRALEEVPNARFVLITSPTYEGIISDMREICRLAHSKNVPVITDEAHGAHLGLFDVFPQGAIQAGADIVIQSLHKTLPSLTQTAIVHLNGARVNRHAFRHALDIFQTSSPSYLLLSSIDGCVQLMERRGKPLLTEWLASLQSFYREAASLRALSVRQHPHQDPGKLVIETNRAGISGFALMDRLRDEFHIELEMAMPHYALAMTGAGDTPETLNALIRAIRQIDASLPSRELSLPVPTLSALPDSHISPREALSAPQKALPFADAAGQVSAEYAWAYPPGIPILVPGERIPAEFPTLWQNLRQSGAKTLTTSGIPDRICVVL